MENIIYKKSDSKKIEIINFLKGFSIFTIVLMHLIQNHITALPGSVKKLSSFGGSGVHIFFLCSGFGLYYSYIKHKTDFKEFIKKRFGKIYIPYILIVVISFFLPWMYDGQDKLTALLSHVFLFKMFVPKYNESFGYQLWFISTIIQFYFVFIILCSIKEKLKNSRKFFSICLILSMLWWITVFILGKTSQRVWNSFFLQYLWEFSLGMYLADIFKERKIIRLNNLVLFILCITGCGLQAGMGFISENLKVFNDIPGLIGYGSLALLIYNLKFVQKIIIKISEFSYTWYLIHVIVFITFFNFAETDTLKLQVIYGCAALLLSIIFAVVYNKIIKIILSSSHKNR